MAHVSRSQVREMVGQRIYAMRKDGSVVSGKLIGIRGNELIMEEPKGKAHTQAFLPLVLFDLLAIGTTPFFGFGFDGFFW
ncbi:ribosomal protein L35AE/L33A [Cohnella kolymensis]|uniref:Ribosomal protein L35AE/L33A n=1 Tax=Cohnella kolymensis TaxID=1590652 RepID=A0ABR5A657_9BACL|nr:hypothetical protein [Cohnella kolymensis]KIL35922.1 ribosomal protein L35AE/L33A [Cohnella kolymensis]